MDRIHSRWRSALGLAFGVSLLSIVPVAAAELTVWCWDPNFNGATMKEAGERYKATHPDVTLNIVDFAKADLEQKLQAQLASGTTEGLPDIVLIEDYGAQKYLQSFPGAFEPLNGKIDYGAFAPYKVELATVDGKTYSLPFDSGVTGLFYRSDYLEGGRLRRGGPSGHHLGPAHRDRQGRQGKDRPSAARHRHQRRGHHPHHAAVGRQVVLHARWGRRPSSATRPSRRRSRPMPSSSSPPTSTSLSPAGTNIPAPSRRAKPPRSLPACG